MVGSKYMEVEKISVIYEGESEEADTEGSMRYVLAGQLPRRGRCASPAAVQDTRCFIGKTSGMSFRKAKETPPRPFLPLPLLPDSSYHYSPHIKGSVHFGTMQPKELLSLSVYEGSILHSGTEAWRKFKGGSFSKTIRFLRNDTVGEGSGSFPQERKAEDVLKYKGVFGKEERFSMDTDKLLRNPGPGDYKVSPSFIQI